MVINSNIHMVIARLVHSNIRMGSQKLEKEMRPLKVLKEFAKSYQIHESTNAITCRCWDCNGTGGLPSYSGKIHECILCDGNGTITILKEDLI